MDLLKEIFLYQADKPMIFTEFFFWGFFAFVLGIFSLIHKKRLLRNTFLFAVSLFFYYKSSGLFFVLLIFSTVVDFFIGNWMNKTGNQRIRFALMVGSICVNLSILFYFKFAYFFTDTFNLIFHTDVEVFNYFTHWANSWFGTDFRVDKILLPVGVSFYTFQTISYSVDVYKHRLEPVKNFLDFGFFVSFFPQLVAGPIVRAYDFVPQIYQDFSLTRQEFGLAVFWILKGLMKKIFIADYIAVNFIDRVFDNPHLFTGFENLMALYGYSLQVYCDFAGYTDIAIGVSLLMGFRLPPNFNSPYKARSVAEFWKRWHISLSSWLQDYLYFPLGGSKKSSFLTYFSIPIFMLAFMYFAGGKYWIPIYVICLSAFPVYYFLCRRFPDLKKEMDTNANLLITMLLGGMWHGASWLFIIWGGLNGLGLIVYKQWRKISPWENKTGLIATAWKILLTFHFISFTRIWFRSDSLQTAGSILNQISESFNFVAIPGVFVHYWYVFAIMAFGMFLHWLPDRWKEKYRDSFINMPIAAQVAVCVLIIFIVYQHKSAEMHPFIYFQF